MAQWGRNDQGVTANSSTTKETSNGAPMGLWSRVKGGGEVASVRSDGANAHFGNTSSGSRAAVDVTLFGNTTVGAFIPGKAVGVFAVNAAMMASTGGNVVIAYVTSGGSGYQANAAVTLTVTNGGSGAVVNAHANTSTNAGRIDSLLISTPGAGYVTSPTVAIAAPGAINIAANTNTIPVPAANNITANTAGVVNNALLITSANTKWNVNDHLYYGVPASNTAIPGLTGNSYYYVAFANSTGIQLSSTVGGSVITLSPGTSSSGETHTVTGDASFIKVTTANSYWQIGDRFYYGVPTSNTAFGGLSSNSYYYISFANTTGIKIANSPTGANLTFGVTTIPTASSPETHTIKGDTATGYVDVNTDNPLVTHVGWVLRTEGTGGRAGRVHYETLVAMHSIGQSGTTATGVTGPSNTVTSNTVDQYV